MKKILILVSIMMLVLLTQVSATDQSYIFKQDTSASLIVSCFNETGAVCDSSTICYMTVIKPSSDILLDNVTLTKTSNYYNYSLNTSQTSDLGEYSAVVNCVGTTSGFSTFNYLITRSGKVLDTSESILYFLLTGAVFICFLISLFFTIKIPYNNPRDDENYIIKITRTKYVKMFFIGITYSLFVWFLNVLIGVSDNFVNLSLYYGFISFLFTTLVNLTWPIYIIILIWGIFEIIRDSNAKDLINKMGKA